MFEQITKHLASISKEQFLLEWNTIKAAHTDGISVPDYLKYLDMMTFKNLIRQNNEELSFNHNFSPDFFGVFFYKINMLCQK
ncbi:MAG: hypothetical protein ACKVOU_09500 [Cytophagales bacterium]